MYFELIVLELAQSLEHFREFLQKSLCSGAGMCFWGRFRPSLFGGQGADVGYVYKT